VRYRSDIGSLLSPTGQLVRVLLSAGSVQAYRRAVSGPVEWS
jgi:hypothetical protein